MRKSALTILVFLALAGVTFATPVLSIFENAPPSGSLRSYTIRAAEDTGTAIINLSKFEITTAVNQVFTDAGASVFSVESAWLGDGSSNGASDSYVIFGDLRIDGYALHDPDPDPVYVTKETNTLAPGAAEGPGTMNNYDADGGVGATGGPPPTGGAPTWDAYLDTTPDYNTGGGLVVDLLQLVVADTVAAGDIVLTLTLTSATGPLVGDVLGPYDLVLPNAITYIDGDANKDGIVDLIDLGRVGLNWESAVNFTWEHGNFNGDSIVDLIDLGRLGLHWGETSPWYVPVASAVPEPSTIVMLILGALCLVGYRARK